MKFKKLGIGMVVSSIIGLTANSAAVGSAITKKDMDRIILEKAAVSQTVMFGELHYDDNYRPYHKDSDYVISLLSRLIKLGYTTLVVEEKYVNDGIVQGYAKGQVSDKEISERIPRIEVRSGKKLIRVAGQLGYSVRALDGISDTDSIDCGVEERDKATFGNVEHEILDKNPSEKVIFFYGRNHIAERENGQSFLGCPITTLGYHLENYGKNVSIDLTNSQDLKNAGIDLSFDLIAILSHSK